MGLNVEIFEDHLIITDGCEVDCGKSNIVKNPRMSFRDEIMKNSSGVEAHRCLWSCNVVVAKGLYEAIASFELRCPSCGKTYQVGRNELVIGAEACRKIHEIADDTFK